MSRDVVLDGVGLYVPKDTIDNDELVASFNLSASRYNEQHPEDQRPFSDATFIEKASGIRSRHVIDKAGILDVDCMRPRLSRRDNDVLSIQAEMAVKAAEDVLAQRQLSGADIDGIILSCSMLQRGYPAISIEVQAALGIDGFSYDMSMACSSATFGFSSAYHHIASGQANRVLVLSPEICTAHLDFTDRDTHFIFGDACTAMLLESADLNAGFSAFKVIDCELKTVYSNNIRNNFGFLNHCEAPTREASELSITQQGRKVFKEVVPMASDFMKQQLQRCEISATSIKRLWLHQANSNMNRLIATKVLGFEPDNIQAPQILDRYGNTSSAGSVIAFQHHHEDFTKGDLGVLCSFGAGYSIGSIILQKI